MVAFLKWAEATSLGHWMRESSPWTFAFINVAHVLGVALLFGSVVVIDLRLLGLHRRLPMRTLVAAATPVTIVGVAIALVSGSMLLTTKATAYINNPFLLIKFPAIAVGLLNASFVRLLPAWRALDTRELSHAERGQLAVIGAISLTAWLTAIAAGRLIGYW